MSIIVPAYNIEQYVWTCISSILNQTHKNIEIIIVNDGSKDGTGGILDALAEKDSRIRVIHKENGGVTSARLRGIAEATGEWIGFVDGDDYIEPQMYERLLNNAFKYGAQISHCGYQMVFPKGHVDYYYNTGRLVQQDRQAGLMALLDGSYIEPGLCNKLFHKSLFHSLLHDGLMDTTIRNTEDLLMNYYLFREAKQTVYEDFCPYHYMLRASSATTSGYTEHKLKDPMRVVRILLKETERESSVHAIARRKYIRTLIEYATVDCSHESDMVRQYRREMRLELMKALLQTIADAEISFKLKGMALFAGLLPDAYCCVHKVYSRIKGNDQIYSLDK
ncbi:MAG: glycosyltransferase family 2 protein [Clostridia bacterium]|nr:glycosyltransferase family 2 protein [Clostridia bacterium]